VSLVRALAENVGTRRPDTDAAVHLANCCHPVAKSEDPKGRKLRGAE
jgi:hypothetical protein